MTEEQTVQEIDQTRTQEIQARVDQMDEMQLYMRREELVRLYESDPRAFSIDNLTEMCAVNARLRAKKSGPAKKGTTRKRVAKQLPSIDELPLD